jgi:hypothetical protein
MHTYIEIDSGLFTVGHYSPAGEFEPESDHTSREAAGKRVNYLNGQFGLVSEANHQNSWMCSVRSTTSSNCAGVK